GVTIHSEIQFHRRAFLATRKRGWSELALIDDPILLWNLEHLRIGVHDLNIPIFSGCCPVCSRRLDEDRELDIRSRPDLSFPAWCSACVPRLNERFVDGVTFYLVFSEVSHARIIVVLRWAPGLFVQIGHILIRHGDDRSFFLRMVQKYGCLCIRVDNDRAEHQVLTHFSIPASKIASIVSVTKSA